MNLNKWSKKKTNHKKESKKMNRIKNNKTMSRKMMIQKDIKGEINGK